MDLDKYELVEAALSELNFPTNYLPEFKNFGLTDFQVKSCIKSGNTGVLKSIFPVLGHYVKFSVEFTNRVSLKAEASAKGLQDARSQKADYGNLPSNMLALNLDAPDLAFLQSCQQSAVKLFNEYMENYMRSYEQYVPYIQAKAVTWSAEEKACSYLAERLRSALQSKFRDENFISVQTSKLELKLHYRADHYLELNERKNDTATVITPALRTVYSGAGSLDKTIIADTKSFYSQELVAMRELATSKFAYLREEEKLRNSILAQVVSVKDSDDIIADLIEYMDAEKYDVLLVLELQLQAEEAKVKSAFNQSREVYEEVMEKRMVSKSWFEPAELERIQKDILEDVISFWADKAKLKAGQTDQLRQAFQSVLKRYAEENIRRCPTAEPAIGIDLGTTYSCVGVYINGRVEIIPDINYDHDKKTLPSYVAFNEDGTVHVGIPAKEDAFINPQCTVFDAKRLIGRKFNDACVKSDMKFWPFDVVDREGEPRISVRGREYRAEEISAKVLAKLKQMAENYLGKKVKKAVITVPAYFGDAQRKATKDAADLAGLEARILNEPSAAAVAYQLHRKGDPDRNVLIFDLGGGTFDVAIICLQNGEINVKAIGGDTHLGGEDFDHAMVEEIIKRVKVKHGIDLAKDCDSPNSTKRFAASRRIRRLRTICENKKRSLSIVETVKISAEFLYNNFDLNEKFTRDEFNEINGPLFQKCLDVVKSTLTDAKLEKSQIHEIVLIGGSTKIPKIQQMIEDFFEHQVPLDKTINPDEAVAYGAAYQAALLHGMELPDDRNVPRLIKDVTPHSLGIHLYPVRMDVLIPRNTPIPCSVKQEPYPTIMDDQTECGIRIYEGEDRSILKNTHLGDFTLKGIPPAPAGKESIQCTMKIDDEGILHVTAKVVTSGESATLQVEPMSCRMTLEEKSQLKREEPFRWTSAVVEHAR